jgi:hypothetical protein
MCAAKRTASDKLWLEKSNLKGPGIGSVILLTIVAVALFLIS